ncbi:kelch domain-containing protein [Rutstroemia sp. NJR-2017a WRK4]|nr:kelch domain-containing protein [Rutstroemia sp. NJR-2017a WRK4]
MAQPSTPGGTSHSIFGSTSNQGGLSNQLSGSTALLPGSVASANNTFLMPNSPVKGRMGMDGYRPKVTRTLGQRPACLVNASVTYCGNNQIYAFGGFDQYTDEVYNHVLRLDLVSHQWNLVDNYGDIPGVRMGHTATLYQGDKLLIFGGENEHRTYLSDLIIFDLKTAHWTQPTVSGPIPKGRARHAAVLHEDKLFIIGGITGHNNYVLDDICYLDLKTFTWSRAWRFVGRFDHSAYLWGDRVWVFGGLSEEMDKIGDIWWLDFKGSPAFDSAPSYGSMDRHAALSRLGSPRPSFSMPPNPAVGTSGYAANSSSAQVNPPSFQLTTSPPIAPGTISSLKFVSGPNIPAQGSGMHFHVYTSGTLLDFVTPAATITPQECSLSALDLDTLRWQKLAEGRDIFRSSYRWHYCTMNDEGTKAWLLGCPTDPTATDLGPGGFEEYLSRRGSIDLQQNWLAPDAATSPPIYVHKLILQARWPHFARLYNAQMAEFHTKRMHIPEPYSVVKAFLYYLYTDSIHPDDCAELNDVAGLLVMSNIYNIPHLRLLCVNRLSKELDVDHACIIWHSAGVANEEWLRRRAASFCLLHWGRVVRTEGFLKLPRHALVELSQEIDMEGRVVGGEELEYVGGLGGARFGVGGVTRKTSVSSSLTQGVGSEVDDNEEMEMT